MGWIQTCCNKLKAYRERRQAMFRVNPSIVYSYVTPEEQQQPERLYNFFSALLYCANDGKHKLLTVYAFDFDFSRGEWIVACYGPELDPVQEGQLLPELTLVFTQDDTPKIKSMMSAFTECREVHILPRR